MDIVIATIHKDAPAEGISSGTEWNGAWPPSTLVRRGRGANRFIVVKGYGVINQYQRGFEISTEDAHEFIGFIHDDVIVHEEAWDERVTAAFADPQVGLIGFGGALQHGSPDIYKTPYRLGQLGRSFYFSNTDDAELHGTRFSAEREVAVLDGFALVFRRSVLARHGGWPVGRYPPHHTYDYWSCCSVHHLGYRVLLVGVRCHHLGGLTATRADYQDWARTTKWGSDAAMHEAGHRLIYEEFRDVLPWRSL